MDNVSLDPFDHLAPLLSLFPLPYSVLLPTIDQFTDTTGIDVFPSLEIRRMVEGWVEQLIATEAEEGSDGVEGSGGMEESKFREMLSLLAASSNQGDTSSPPASPSPATHSTNKGPKPPPSALHHPTDGTDPSVPIVRKIRRNSHSGRTRSLSDTSGGASDFRSDEGAGSASEASEDAGDEAVGKKGRTNKQAGSKGSRSSVQPDERDLDGVEAEADPEADDSGFGQGYATRGSHRSFPSHRSTGSRGSSVGAAADGESATDGTGLSRRRRVRSNRSEGSSSTSSRGKGNRARSPPPPLPPTPKGPFSNRVGLSFPLSSPTRTGYDPTEQGRGQTPPSAFSMGVGLGRKYVTSDPLKGAAVGLGGDRRVSAQDASRASTGRSSRGNSSAGTRSRVPSDSSEWATATLRRDEEDGAWDESTPVKRNVHSSRGAPPNSFGMAQGKESGQGGSGRRNSVGNDRVMISPAMESPAVFGDRSSSNPITRPKPPHRSTRRQSSGPVAQMMSPTSPSNSMHPYFDHGLASPPPASPAFFDSSRPQAQAKASRDSARSPGIDENSFVAAGMAGWLSPGREDENADGPQEELDGWGRHRREDRYSRMASSSDESFKQEYDELQRENNDLKRKKESLEKALIDTKSELDNEMARLQGEIDETHVQLKEKKIEDGENAKRMAERLEHIKSLEATVSSLQDRLNAAAKGREADQRNINQILAEKSVLRAEIADHKHKLAELEESEQSLLTEKNITEVQLNSLTRSNEQLLSYKVEAERIARELDNQKQVNHQLRDEISRLEGTLEDARSRHARDGTSASGITMTDSEGGTVSRNLGAEMMRSKFGQEEEASLGTASAAETPQVIPRGRERTILRTTIHYRPTPTNVAVGEPTTDDDVSTPSTPEAGDTTEEQILEVSYADATTSTEAPAAQLDVSAQTDDSMLGSLPPYTREDADFSVHPKLLGGVRPSDMSQEEHEALQRAYGQVSSSLGTRCTELEHELQGVQKAFLASAGSRNAGKSGADLSKSSLKLGAGKLASRIRASESKLLSPYLIVPSCLLLAGAIGYMIGIDRGSITLSKLDEILLLRDIAALTSGSAAAGFGHAGLVLGGGNQNNFLAGSYVMKAVGGGGRMAVGRVPM